MTVLAMGHAVLRRQRGVTLIELMVAMVLGLLVAAGIVTVFSSTSSSNKSQTQLARLQEEGRFAISRLGSDLRMANGQYCTNSGGTALAASGGLYLDHLRTPYVYAKSLLGTAAGADSGALHDLTTLWAATSGGVTYPAAPTAPYSMPSFLYMRGYDCGLTSASCTPIDPTTAGLPAMGKAIGDRVIGSSVITVRYVNPSSGWSIGSSGGSSIAASSSTGAITSITLKPLSSELPASHFAAGDLAMLADCSSAEIFAVTNAAGVLTPDSTKNFTGSTPAAQQPEAAPTLFDVNQDLQSVTYYLKVVDAGNGFTTGALIRRVNGGDTAYGVGEEELVRGIERMDFLYGVQDATGNTSFLTASQIEASTSCPPSELNAVTTTGCLWRAVTSIEVSVLMDGQVPLYTLDSNDLNYVYTIDSTTSAPPSSATHTVKPSDQGFVDQLLRRQFTALVAVRNYNP
ncbi:hypothetical protein B0E46_05770 [Rhodanobacter sp. B04]|uniref:PilW family protein n=1 Tax=Rhodanobacter sp. B04 TaxID=1945860 RepID=UPI0009866469|nr:PilW family protein [Rhodanobacter sp. B04]OOG64899.1 hypothetical protein B0E46_05770 [Rhodanobacter sp. B04]